MQTIEVTQGDGVAFLEQDSHGTAVTLIVSAKQFADISWFLSNPNTSRIRSKDSMMAAVVVDYSSKDDSYTLTQGNQKLMGSRKSENCGFSVVLWMHDEAGC